MSSLVVSRCQVDGLPPQAAADPAKPAEVVPRVWPELAPQVQKQSCLRTFLSQFS